jgi:hypothetical protein
MSLERQLNTYNNVDNVYNVAKERRSYAKGR